MCVDGGRSSGPQRPRLREGPSRGFTGPGEAAGGGGGRSPAWCWLWGRVDWTGLAHSSGGRVPSQALAPSLRAFLGTAFMRGAAPGWDTKSVSHSSVQASGSFCVGPSVAGAWATRWGGPLGPPIPSVGHRLLPREDRVRASLWAVLQRDRQGQGVGPGVCRPLKPVPVRGLRQRGHGLPSGPRGTVQAAPCSAPQWPHLQTGPRRAGGRSAGRAGGSGPGSDYCVQSRLWARGEASALSPDRGDKNDEMCVL